MLVGTYNTHVEKMLAMVRRCPEFGLIEALRFYRYLPSYDKATISAAALERALVEKTLMGANPTVLQELSYFTAYDFARLLPSSLRYLLAMTDSRFNPMADHYPNLSWEAGYHFAQAKRQLLQPFSFCLSLRQEIAFAERARDAERPQDFVRYRASLLATNPYALAREEFSAQAKAAAPAVPFHAALH